MRSLSQLFLLLAATATLSSQPGWVWQNPHPQGSDLYSIQVLDANTAVTVGNFHAILRTTDAGATWTEISDGGPSAISASSSGQRMVGCTGPNR